MYIYQYQGFWLLLSFIDSYSLSLNINNDDLVLEKWKNKKSYLLFPVVTFYGDQDFSLNLIWLQPIFLRNPIVISFALEVLQPAFVRFALLQVFLFLMLLPHPQVLSSENTAILVSKKTRKRITLIINKKIKYKTSYDWFAVSFEM